jgi:hypothetical protein
MPKAELYIISGYSQISGYGQLGPPAGPGRGDGVWLLGRAQWLLVR